MLSKMHPLWLTDPEDLWFLKQRYNSFAHDRFPGLDLSIRPLIEEMAAMPGNVVPVWSCSSHPDTEENSLYVAMGVDQEGFEAMVYVYRRYFDMLEAQDRLNDMRADLHLVRLLNKGFDMNMPGAWSGLKLKIEFYENHTHKVVNQEIATLVGLIKAHGGDT